MIATFTAIQWSAAFTRVDAASNPATWAEMTEAWSTYSSITWADLT